MPLILLMPSLSLAAPRYSQFIAISCLLSLCFVNPTIPDRLAYEFTQFSCHFLLRDIVALRIVDTLNVIPECTWPLDRDVQFFYGGLGKLT